MNTIIQQIDTTNIPQHVAIIMDGNGRWAKKQGLMRNIGHTNGIKSVKEAMRGCKEAGVKYLTLYAFSTENWNRPKIEVNLLMSLLMKSIKDEINEFMENDIRLKVIGNIDRLPSSAQKELLKAIELTKNNTSGVLTVALSYGSQDEILQATKKIAQQVKNNELTIDEITQEVFEKNLFTYDLPPVDLLIRTSGEARISNFLLWQIAYAELYFTNVLWPDFRKENLFEAIIDYQNRERRYGKTSEQIVNS